MTNSRSSESCVVDSYLGPSSTCTGRIARIFATIAACSFTCALSSAVAAGGIYFFDFVPEGECSAKALSSFSVVASIIATVSSISAISIGYRLCGNYDVYSSSVSSISSPPLIPSIAVAPSSRGVSSSSLSPCNISSNISSQRSSTNFDVSSSHAVVSILSKSKPINCLEFLEFLETSL
ncbi:MAG: hypothetical protein sL5_01920 [Candidatus Mesenet longicola]|uniref:Uncharacterized protein n=1 Tax=Candidatus Mesenet longicola TaxID=1892558 RepID=A0A8J3HNM7_9RICK|nr:MAG: hypothetical protein sGL2_01470 [Candidatus Mesenet longicola]GHM59199.1 MAG: hypothetical protein sL5_01920 [Candidatus Mesenet longicola]